MAFYLSLAFLLQPLRPAAAAEPAALASSAWVVPWDLLPSSGSGLDPDISPQYAAIQVSRVAAARHLPVSQVQALVSKYTQGRNIGFLGEPRVDVLNLNIALDELPGQAQYAQAGA